MLSLLRSTHLSVHLSVCLSVCLSVSICLEPLDRSSQNFMCRSPVAVAQSSSVGVALRYVLPVLWMMSRLAIMGSMALHGRPDLLLPSVMCVTGAESDVYECLVVISSNCTGCHRGLLVNMCRMLFLLWNNANAAVVMCSCICLCLSILFVL